MSRIKEVFDGWKNHLLPPKGMEETIIEMSTERLDICRQCPFNSVNAGISSLIRSEYCTKCGCPLEKKTKSPTSKCPLSPPKWEAFLSLNEYDILKKQMKQ